MDNSYTLIRSRRKTLSLSVTPEGVVVRAPLRLARRDIDAFVESRRDWIAAQEAKINQRRLALADIPPLTQAQLAALKAQARAVFSQRAAHLAPPEVLDSVVVHELCHILEHNHSPRFYAQVLRVFPDYRQWNAWLKAHGPELMRRLGA